MQRYHSEVQTLTTRAADHDRFTVVPIEGVSAADAARQIAQIAARRRFDDDGSVGFLRWDGTDGWYRATIGVQQRSHDGIALKGVTISIHVWPTD
jgi:hypothetical protein